jgi:hypothetical protein
MNRLIILVFCCFIHLGFPTDFLRGQPAEKKQDGWVDVLRNDPRLKVAVKFKFDSWPTAEEVLATLQKATGVPLSLAGQTEKGKVSFGNANVSNVPAWIVMQQLAVSQVTDGKWEKTGDGYVFHGKQKDFGGTADRPGSEKAKAAKKAYDEAVAKHAKAQADLAKFHPLSLDPKLRALLSVVEKHPKLADILIRLGACTGLNFTLADNLTQHDPDLGEWTLPNVPAYSIMEIITDKQLDNGHWEKTPDGYRLTGVSKALPAVSTAPPDLGPANRTWLLYTAAGLVLLLLLLSGAYYVRRGFQRKSTKV